MPVYRHTAQTFLNWALHRDGRLVSDHGRFTAAELSGFHRVRGRVGPTGELSALGHRKDPLYIVHSVHYIVQLPQFEPTDARNFHLVQNNIFKNTKFLYLSEIRTGYIQINNSSPR